MNLDDEEKKIELSKKKILLIFIVACAFVAAGIWLFQMNSAEIESQRRYNSPLFVRSVGLMSIALFGYYGVFWFKKLFEKEPGLILSEVGILDNSGFVSGSDVLIPWSDIVGFDIWVRPSHKMLIVKLSNPEKYIEDASTIKRIHIIPIYKMYGSPILISSNSLKISFEDLVDTCNEYFLKYGKKAA